VSYATFRKFRANLRKIIVKKKLDERPRKWHTGLSERRTPPGLNSPSAETLPTTDHKNHPRLAAPLKEAWIMTPNETLAVALAAADLALSYVVKATNASRDAAIAAHDVAVAAAYAARSAA
jgi:hypothetical protein